MSNSIRKFSKATHTRVYKARAMLIDGLSFDATCIKSNLIPDVVKRIARDLIKSCPMRMPQNLVDSGHAAPQSDKYQDIIEKLKEDITNMSTTSTLK